MKKRVLKDWVVKIILIVQMLLIVIMAAECEDLTIFIISKIIVASLFILNHLIICKYSNFYQENETWN